MSGGGEGHLCLGEEKVTYVWGRRRSVLVIVTLICNYFFIVNIYLINHVSAKALITERMIPSETNNPPTEVSTQG